MSQMSTLQVPEQLIPRSAPDLVALIAACMVSAIYLLRGIVWDKPDPYHHVWFEKPTEKFHAAVQPSRPETRNIAEKLATAGKDIVIFWGSQSGTGESFAVRLAKEISVRFGRQTLCADLADYDPETIGLIPATKLAIFIMSTYGEGDPSDNAAAFWNWLHQSSPSVASLGSLRYVAFGLGNSKYRYYNKVIDVAVASLDKAGARSLITVGKADDARGGTEEDFLSWKCRLFDLFQAELGFVDAYVGFTPSITVTEDRNLTPIDLITSFRSRDDTHPRDARIMPLAIGAAHCICSSSGREYIHMELDIPNHTDLRYRTGDHLAVHPVNPTSEIELLLKATGYDGVRAKTPLVVRSIESDSSLKLPSPATLERLLRHHLEICAPVSRELLKTLAQYAPTPNASKLLLSLAENKAAYAKFVAENHITMGRLLSLAAPNLVWGLLPLSFLLETLPTMKPRYYSISSSSAVSPHSLAITVGVVSNAIAPHSSITVPGVASNYLLSVADDVNDLVSRETSMPEYPLPELSGSTKASQICASICPSSFKLPKLSTTPLIMIAAGTGIAPFRAFIQERARLHSVGQPVGKMLLFFGCRNQDDFLYQEEISEAVSSFDGSLKVITAFSRSRIDHKYYVQDRVAERRQEVCELLDDRASIYICGRVVMAKQVGEVVWNAMRVHNDWHDTEVKRWAESMTRGGKWLQDVWG
ncbi:hypothetical protein QQS21_002753 [Conoideocrella luteorostrata]|uniref:NADPH--cytochrome P450 reductase n=1 Tax=Conoideocrella luteorostrata TaxID=1105319 RepID=A0AAJ0G149_9HYPO|nr:hypothetical protein QQS21_002753 [Conoideocrella luteorostrata]